MAEGEARVLAELNRLREQVLDPSIARHGGRIVKLMGDGALAEFGSMFDAADCATAIRTTLAEQPRYLTLRIGLNLG